MHSYNFSIILHSQRALYLPEGSKDGSLDGSKLGSDEGKLDGADVGEALGRIEGSAVGVKEGCQRQ